MTRILIALTCLFFLGCAKDYSYEAVPGLNGKWVINAIRYPNNRPSIEWASHPPTQKIHFLPNGKFEGLTEQNYFHLMFFDRYELKSSHTIRFYSSINNDEVWASYEMGNELTLTFGESTGYVWVEKYQRY